MRLIALSLVAIGLAGCSASGVSKITPGEQSETRNETLTGPEKTREVYFKFTAPPPEPKPQPLPTWPSTPVEPAPKTSFLPAVYRPGEATFTFATYEPVANKKKTDPQPPPIVATPDGLGYIVDGPDGTKVFVPAGGSLEWKITDKDKGSGATLEGKAEARTPGLETDGKEVAQAFKTDMKGTGVTPLGSKKLGGVGGSSSTLKAELFSPDGFGGLTLFGGIVMVVGVIVGWLMRSLILGGIGVALGFLIILVGIVAGTAPWVIWLLFVAIVIAAAVVVWQVWFRAKNEDGVDVLAEAIFDLKTDDPNSPGAKILAKAQELAGQYDLRATLDSVISKAKSRREIKKA